MECYAASPKVLTSFMMSLTVSHRHLGLYIYIYIYSDMMMKMHVTWLVSSFWTFFDRFAASVDHYIDDAHLQFHRVAA